MLRIEGREFELSPIAGAVLTATPTAMRDIAALSCASDKARSKPAARKFMPSRPPAYVTGAP